MTRYRLTPLYLARGLLLAVVAFAALPAAAQRGGSGQYRAVLRVDPGLPTHTIYRPRLLAPFGDARRLPIVAWGNGGCVNVGDASRNFLTEIASHGMLVIAVGPILGDRPPRDAGRPAMAAGAPLRSAPPTRAEQLTEAIDWAVAENARQESDYFGKLDADAIAVMGYSCGGLQALSQVPDPRIKTIALWNSGVPPAGDRRPGLAVGKDILARLQVPVAYIAGGPTDIAYANAVDDVSRIQGVPLFFGNLDVGHGGTYAESNGGAYGAVASAWLRWQLLGDTEAARTFVGDDCLLCVDPDWTIEKHNIE